MLDCLNRRPIAVSMGDPAGVGPEVIARAWEKRASENLPSFVAIGDAGAVEAVWDGPIARITDMDDACEAYQDALPIWHMRDAGPITPGHPTPAGAGCALLALETAIGFARTGASAALVTGPVSKHELQSIGYTHPGQTEFIAERCGVMASNAVMMLAGPGLRVVPLTIHIPLSEVPERLTTDLIISRARVVARGLSRDFGIAEPRMAICGLNPHAGENGRMGDEEGRIIQPAVEALAAEGIVVDGPYAADGLFSPTIRTQYDAILCAYHDQALAPFKALHFHDGVNLTLGLPIIRTSPDHGTAFNIAGKGLADPGPTIAAIKMAAELAEARERASIKT